ncbi:MAG TPA: tRNA (adenosine(37)-N6)-threonylcarbamoyltransferase complex transferase subunit TsaD [Thermomicrobiales bacterium]|nr:tRNA (adenosine(37)-N6)-threonylcarbamoyltransferase complex transferase subunit TsaD [Thermomicrobiales bacterium]
MNILGIETSCDETAAAVVADGRRVRSNVIASQIELHRAHGGVVPELAARGHVTAILPVIERALDDAGASEKDVEVIAVTAGPGLAGALLVGMNVAKALAYAWGKPLVPVNHLEAHVYANWLTFPDDQAVLPPPELPAVCLLVSGGHTELILVEDHGRYRHLGRTLDDAAGEAFDKGARLLGLGYPGGPAIQEAARDGDPRRHDLPRAWLGESDDFSFSGLKTALLRLVDPYRLPAPDPRRSPSTPFAEHRPPSFRDDLPRVDLAAAFQEAVVEVLAVKTAGAVRREGARSVLLAGGVAANRALRERVMREVECVAPEVPVRVPRLELCTDNAAMIAGAAYYALRRGEQAGWEADIAPRLPLVSTS